jgi:hypothetical protein
MFEVLGLALSAGATFLGYTQTRSFVRNRLRFVDAVQRAGVPIVAGVAAFAVALPATGLIPLIGGGTAILFAGAVGMGVSHGRGDIRHRIGSGR